MANLTREEEEALRASMKARKTDGQIGPIKRDPNNETTETVSIENPATVEPENKHTTSNRGKTSKQSYNELFLQKRGVRVRHCAYIDKEVYRKAAKYAKFIAEDGVTVGEYLDLIILNHFEEYKDEIRKRMRKAAEM